MHESLRFDSRDSSMKSKFIYFLTISNFHFQSTSFVKQSTFCEYNAIVGNIIGSYFPEYFSII